MLSQTHLQCMFCSPLLGVPLHATLYCMHVWDNTQPAQRRHDSRPVPQVLLLAWKMRAKRMGYFSREEFHTGASGVSGRAARSAGTSPQLSTCAS